MFLEYWFFSIEQILRATPHTTIYSMVLKMEHDIHTYVIILFNITLLYTYMCVEHFCGTWWQARPPRWLWPVLTRILFPTSWFSVRICLHTMPPLWLLLDAVSRHCFYMQTFMGTFSSSLIFFYLCVEYW